MISPERPKNETDRISELYKYELLDTVYEDEFDELVRLASKICQVPISLITLVDMNRQWFKAKYGLEANETERNISFCGHAILTDNLFEVQDAIKDERFHDNPLVLGDLNIRYYAGMPLVTESGYKIGTLCIIDRVPRKLDSEQVFAMKVLSQQVVKLFELRIRNKDLKRVTGVQHEIITILAHDIRNPLAAIKSTLDLKNDGLLTDADQKEIDELTTVQLDGTLQLLDNIVDWGKLRMSGSKQGNTLFNLHDLCDECFRQIALSSRSKKNELINSIDPALNIEANRQGVAFIIRNILVNANKFTEAGKIIVSAMVTKGILTISIKDTGVGMSEKAKASLRERTWSATQRGTQKEKGSGVGLKLIFEYLQDMDGNVDFISAPGAGTTVAISLPFTMNE